MSYFLVRLMQQFDGFTLAKDCQPVESLPPPEWKDMKGRQSEEELWPSIAMTLFIKVSASLRDGKVLSLTYVRADYGSTSILRAKIHDIHRFSLYRILAESSLMDTIWHIFPPRKLSLGQDRTLNLSMDL